MANTVISNNGNGALPAIYDIENNLISEASPPDPSIRITNVQTQEEIILAPGISRGLSHGAYLIEVI